ncbi:MAG: 50S ribosomal protein L29 [Candidatus Aenigmarchaeota archaeon]|nr:50S ribosomal protein L29 [Candidatus Aenigmarchaeota archaeon]
MAVIKTKDVRAMKTEERSKRLGEFRLELAKLRGSSAVGASIKQPGKMKELHKAIARILTIDNEEKMKIKKKGGQEA